MTIMYGRCPSRQYLLNPVEFIAMMTGRTRQTQEQAPKPSDLGVDNPEEEWKSAWKEFDHSLKGSITAAQLRQVLGSLGEIIGDAEIDNVIMNSVNAEDKISCEYSGGLPWW